MTSEVVEMAEIIIPDDRRPMRMPGEYERFLYYRMIDKYGRISPQRLADDISRLTKRPCSRQLAHQAMTGRVKAQWLRDAIIEILEDRGENFWPHYNEEPDVLEEDVE